MLSEPLTLYKLMVLYMLKQVNFPLTNTQLAEFFLDREYTSYFTLQQALNELLDAGLVVVETVRNTSRYQITRDGEETLEFFGNQISQAIVDDIGLYIKTNKFRLRSEVGMISDYYKDSGPNYTVRLEVHEGKAPILQIHLTVPDKEQAEIMCGQWNAKSQEIYSFIMKSLMGD